MLDDIVLYGGVALLVLVIYAFMRRRLRERRESWAAYAMVRELSFDGAAMKIAGNLEGWPVVVSLDRRAAGDSSYEVALVRVDLSGELPEDLVLELEGIGSTLIQFVAGKDDQLGDPRFDGVFKLENLSSAARRALEPPEVRQALLLLADQFPGLKIARGVLQLETRDVPNTPDALDAFVGGPLSLGQLLRARSPSATERERV